jgi:hypothetical protein
MNLTLEQAMAQATKGPLEADNFATIWTTAPTQRIDGHVANCSHAAIDPEFRARDFEKANAVLLAHWYNVGPELVEAIKLVRSIIVDGAKTGFNCHDGDWADRLYASQGITQPILTRANTVTIPE